MDDKEVKEKVTPKQDTKPKQPKVTMSPKEIETRYQAHLEKTRGGK